MRLLLSFVVLQCTLRNFPSLDLHCIEWAREKFDDLYVSGADAVNSLLEDREQFLQKLKQDPLSEADALKSVKNWLELAAKPSFEQCAKVMFDEFVANYRNSINDLTHAFPKDARIKDNATGADLGLFWHGHKRFPQSTEFNPNQPEHVDYIYHGANILASVFRLPEQSKEAVKAMLPKLMASGRPWAPSNAKISLDGDPSNPNANADKKPEGPSEEDHALVARLTNELRALDLSKFTPLVSADFEKVRPSDMREHRPNSVAISTSHLIVCCVVSLCVWFAASRTTISTTTSIGSLQRPICVAGITSSRRQPARSAA